MDKYLKESDFVHSFVLVVRLGDRVAVNVLEVGNGDILPEFLRKHKAVFGQLDLAREVRQFKRLLLGLLVNHQ